MFSRYIKQYDECRYTLFRTKRKGKKRNNDRTRRTMCMRKRARNNESQLLVQNS